MGHTYFRGENFHEWHQIREIRESFLPQKFPAIRYIAKTHSVAKRPWLHTLSTLEDLWLVAIGH